VSTPLTHDGAVAPSAPAERDALIDALRGFAVLGILIVNIEVMRGPDWLVLMGGGYAPLVDLSDVTVQFAVGWLGTAKFISSLALLFGVGAAFIASRAVAAGSAPRPLLARRYVALMAFGAVHMAVFPGDILFLYGLTGFVMLLFIHLEVRVLLALAAAALVVLTAFALDALPSWQGEGVGSGTGDTFETTTHALHETTLAAYTEGGLADILAAHAAQAFFLQTGQLLALPWILALFLFGYAVARAGIATRITAHRTLLRRGAWIGLGIGLPANLGVGFFGALAGFGSRSAVDAQWLTQWGTFGQVAGAPILAIGYLCALSLLFADRAPPHALVATGRMALTAYLLQSVIALCVFGGLRLYDRLSSTSALLVVAAVWALLLWLCPLWLRHFRMGPAEWVWRSLTYGRLQPLRRQNPNPSA
jgi:uncharacterized protein